MSKHHVLEHWPQPETVRDVAKIVGFKQFYSTFIPQFELWIAPLCNLTTKLEYTNPVSPHWMTAAQDLLNNIKQVTLSDLCLKRFDHQRLLCFNQTSHQKDSAMYYANPRMTLL
jgi:hypothetical protein